MTVDLDWRQPWDDEEDEQQPEVPDESDGPPTSAKNALAALAFLRTRARTEYGGDVTTEVMLFENGDSRVEVYHKSAIVRREDGSVEHTHGSYDPKEVEVLEVRYDSWVKDDRDRVFRFRYSQESAPRGSCLPDVEEKTEIEWEPPE